MPAAAAVLCRFEPDAGEVESGRRVAFGPVEPGEAALEQLGEDVVSSFGGALELGDELGGGDGPRAASEFEGDGLVGAELDRDGEHHGLVDDAKAVAEDVELGDGASDVVLCDLVARRAAQVVLELVEADEAAVGVSGRGAHLDDLDAQLVEEVAHAEDLAPEAFARPQGIHPNLVAHRGEPRAEHRVGPYLLLVLPREFLQRRPKRPEKLLDVGVLRRL
mmetsp:Transcript_23971/g.75003  ORF Transcript_23971/g.75003 Transcript_23971/m.75003 type:complete len:220 (-) Transcript_23971:105-764(-)